MNFWKPDSSGSGALTGALCEFVQSPTNSNDTLDYSSDGSGTSTPPLPSKTSQKEETIVSESSKKVELFVKNLNVEPVAIEEVGTSSEQPIVQVHTESNSFKKREIKCRNIRKSNDSRHRAMSPPQRHKSVEKSKIKYPANWAEYKELGLNVEKHLAIKSKPKDAKFDFQKFFNFETPSPPTEAFKSLSKNAAVWIQFPYLRCTATKPPVIYSTGTERGYLTRKQLFALIPKNRQQEIEKLMKLSKIQCDFAPIITRKWFSKNWTITDKIEAKLLENSVGLSFLQTYSEEENLAGNLVSQTPPIGEEKEEGEVSDDDSHNLSNSVVEEVKKNKEEVENNKEEVEKPVVETIDAVEPVVETRKKSKKAKANKVSKSVKSKRKTKKKSSKLEQSDNDRKKKLKKKRKNSKDSKQKRKSSSKKDSKKKKKNKSIGAKPTKLEIHPDYQDDIQFFADRLDAERQLKGKTKHKTKLNISLEEFDLDDESTQRKEEIKVDLLKMNEEYLREQKRQKSKERSQSKEKSKKLEEVDSVLENIKQEPNSWESEEEVVINDNQLSGTPIITKPLDLEMPLNIKNYSRREIEKDLALDVATTPKIGRWDIQTSTPTKKIEVLEDEYQEFMKAVTDTVVIDGSFEEIKPVPAPLANNETVTKNITLSVATSSVGRISTPNSLTLSKENVSIPGNLVSTTNIPLDNCDDKISSIDNVATSDSLSVSQEVATTSEIVAITSEPIENISKIAPNEKELVNNVAEDIPAIDKIPEIISPKKTNESPMNLPIIIPQILDENPLNQSINFPIIQKEIINFPSPTKTIPVMINQNYSINDCTDKDAFNIPLDKDIDIIESEQWKQTFKPIMLPMKTMLSSSKLNLEDFNGPNETVIEQNDIKHSPKRTKKEPIKKHKESSDKRHSKRHDSPNVRKRSRDFSPIRRKRSPLKRRNSPRSRRNSSPKRRLSPRRRRSPSPRKKSKYSPSRDRKRSPKLRRMHLPDSTISDDQLAREKSPQRLPLDIRINQVLGLEMPQPSPEFYQYPAEQFCNFSSRAPPQSTYKQVGNMLQIVPVEQEVPQQQIFQNPNLFAAAPLQQPRSQIRQIGNMLEIVPTEMVPPMEQVEIKTEKTDEDFWFSSNEVDSKLSAEGVMLQKEAERLNERENRRLERENRKKEKERRRREREKLRQTKLKAKTEKMIKRALELEIDQMLQEPSQDSPVQWPPVPLVNHLNDFTGKSILVNKLNSLDLEKSNNKTVQFADGIKPGEGTSPSAGEELLSPPPPRLTLPKEKRFKKTLFGKKKNKKKTKAAKKQPPPPVESDSEDNQPPPSPPPGSPPPHIFPPRVKVKPVNNVPAALLASIIQTAQQQQFQQFRPGLNMMMAPPPPLPQGLHNQSPNLPSVSPQLHAPPPPPPSQAGHSRHF